MSNASKNLTKALGGAAAVVLSVAGLARAQQAAAGPARRDSMVAERVIFMPGRMDSIGVIVAKIMHERPGTTSWVSLTSLLDSLLANSVNKQLFMMRGGIVGPPAMMLRSIPVSKGWIGFNTQGPSLRINDSSGTRYRFFAYQPIISVDPGSPADRAGIEPGDLLVAYNGVDLIDHDFNFNVILAPRRHVDVTVRRDSVIRNYALTVATAPEEVARRRVDMEKGLRLEITGPGVVIDDGDRDRGPMGGVAGGGGPVRIGRGPLAGSVGARSGFGATLGSLAGQKLFFFPPNGLFGASLSNVSEDLAKALNIRKGVLANDVPEDSPAFRAGLRSGDVIVTADDDSVTTLSELRNAVMRRLADHSVDLQVVRKQKVRKLTVSWPQMP
jgi:membrane-associated protease RseP (regulator of RpoE activity)